MSQTHFVKDLRGRYGFLVVQGATREETEWFYGLPIEDILGNSEQPTGGLLRIDVHVRNNELETFYQRNGDYWVNAGRFFIPGCNMEGDSAVVNRDVLSEITRMVVEDRDSLQELWAKQRQGWESPEDPSEPRQPLAEPDGEDPPHRKTWMAASYPGPSQGPKPKTIEVRASLGPDFYPDHTAPLKARDQWLCSQKDGRAPASPGTTDKWDEAAAGGGSPIESWIPKSF